MINAHEYIRPEAEGTWIWLPPPYDQYQHPEWRPSNQHRKDYWVWAPAQSSYWLHWTPYAEWGASLLPPLPPSPTLQDYQIPPFPHQESGVYWLLSHRFALLADDMGLGKTKQSIDAVRIRRERGDGGPVLVVTKRSGVGVWIDEIQKNDPAASVSEYKPKMTAYQPPTDWVVTTYDTLRGSVRNPSFAFIMSGKQSQPYKKTDRREILEGSALLFPWHTVVLDEVHQVKNPAAQRTLAILRLRPQYGMMLSGTPIINDLLDAWFPLYWSHMISWDPRNYKLKFGKQGKWGWTATQAGEEKVQHLLRWIMIRRMKTEVLNLPPKIKTKLLIPLTGVQRTAYDQARDEWTVWIQEHPKELSNALDRLMRLKQICGGPHVLDATQTVLTHAKWETFEEQFVPLLEAGQKVVIFTQFLAQWGWLKDKLQAYGVTGIQGRTTGKQRDIAKNQFQTDPATRVFLTTQAGQEAITLTAAQTVVFFDLPWSPAYLEQMEDRVNRIGQTGTVNIYYLLAQHTIEERIFGVNLRDKKILMDLLLTPKQFV